MFFIGSKKDVARFVSDIVVNLNIAWRSITIIPHGKSEVSCVFVAINSQSEDIVETKAQTYYLRRIRTWPKTVPGGSFR